MIAFEGPGVVLHHGDCIEVMRTLPDASVDAVVTDPPYGLEFMGREWDGANGFRRSLNEADAGRDTVFGRTSKRAPEYNTGRGVRVAQERAEEMTPTGQGHSTSAGPYLAARVDSIRVAGVPFQEWCTVWAAEALRVLKPGGHMLAFGGSRTWHRLAVAIEDAGFEIRDSIAWLYGSGFPKSLDVSKAVDAFHGAVRSEGGREWQGGARSGGVMGAGDGTSTRTIYDQPATDDAQAWQGWGTALKPAFEPIVVARKPLVGTVAGNVLSHGTGALNIDANRVAGTKPDTTRGASSKRSSMEGGELAAQGRIEDDGRGRWPTNVLLDASQAEKLDAQTGVLISGRMAAGTQRAPRHGAVYGRLNGDATKRATPGDSGGASRFFPTFRYEAKADSEERPNVNGVQHPTVKPLDLMRWLVRLVTPPNGTILEPFAGSGTTLEAALLEGFQVIGIEREADYLLLIEARITKPLQVAMFGDWEEDA